MASADDETLDPARVAGLYLEHADELRAFLIGVLRSGDLAAEALQSTFARTLESGHKAREETIKGWLFQVALNEALQLKRRQKVQSEAQSRLAENKREIDEQHPESIVCRWETVERVRQELDRLPEEQRRVVRLRIYEGRTFAEIAEELEVPLGTVLTRMRLALKKLTAALGSL